MARVAWRQYGDGGDFEPADIIERNGALVYVEWQDGTREWIGANDVRGAA